MNTNYAYPNTDCYFNKSKYTLGLASHNPRVLFQVFQRKEAVLAGIHLIRDLIANTGVTVYSRNDGDSIQPWETVMTIESKVQDAIQLETSYLGVLSRCTRVATNVREVVKAANGKPVLFFPARFDVPDVQYYDGYAARIGGATACSTYTQMAGFNENATDPIGTMPHALIAAFGGNTVEAALAYAAAHPIEDKWVLVDFENNCAKTAVEVYRAYRDAGYKLAGVRLDTSDKCADLGLQDKAKEWHIETPTGVCEPLVSHVRQALDNAGATDTKICVSGGFTAEKIARFEMLQVPADVYAVGEAMLKGSIPFTSDIVRYMTKDLLWVDCAKVGRFFQPDPRLTKWE